MRRAEFFLKCLGADGVAVALEVFFKLPAAYLDGAPALWSGEPHLAGAFANPLHSDST